ncbi:MAG: DUF4126 family protein [Candidatus Omnitrophica bacterium]|nr:DUF4126 family protein [Candidatus Omnitrophota bacterium]
MEALNSLGTIAASAWASGVNMYLTVALVGISQRLQWIDLPGNMEVLGHPLVILVALVLFAVEFFADKIPLVDSAWDSVHTVIRPAGGALLGYLALADAGPAVRTSAALLTGMISADSHLTKATTRAAINTSPEPVSNSVASVAEDITVIGVLYLAMRHPVIAAIFVVVFLLFSFWFLKMMFRFVKAVFRPRTGRSSASVS